MDQLTKTPAIAKACTLVPRGGRFIKAYVSGAVEVAIYYVAEYKEYCAQVIIDGEVLTDATYYTDDRADVMRTARVMFNAILASQA